MLKDATRDYIVAMFRFYSSLHCPNKQEIYKHKTELSEPQLLDLLAVVSAINEFTPDIKNAVECIYFPKPTVKLRKGEINSRVVDYAIKNYIDERSVWRYLKQARIICARYRNLNTYTNI